MEKVKSLVDFLNQILTNGAQSIDQYEDYYRQISQLLYDIDTEFDLELLTEEGNQGKAVFIPEKNLVQIYLDPDNDFHYFIYEVIDDFLNREDQVNDAVEYFTSLLRNDKLEYIAQVLIGIGDKDELTEEEDKIVTGAHEYLWQLMEMMAGQDEEDIEADMLYSIKAINSLLRFSGLDMQNMRLFELQYDFSMLNLESLHDFLEHDLEEMNLEEEAKEMYIQAQEVIRDLINEIERFSPNPKILAFPTGKMAEHIAQLEYLDILQWLMYLKNTDMAYEFRAVVDRIIDQHQKSLDKQNWDDALVLSNILVSVEPENADFRMLRILALLGLRLFYDAYHDYQKLNPGKFKHDKVYKFIQKRLSSLGLK